MTPTVNRSRYSTRIYVNQYTGQPCNLAEPHAIHFDSVLESRVYSTMLRKNYQIVRQRKIEIKPKTVMFPAITWACDFRIWNKDDLAIGHLNIEAKGLSFAEFTLKLQMLELHAPDEFNRTVMVIQNHQTPIPKALDVMKKSGQIVTIADFYHKLTQLGF